MAKLIEDGFWQIDKLKHMVPLEVLQKIMGSLISANPAMADRLVWKFSNSGSFSHFYLLLS